MREIVPVVVVRWSVLESMATSGVSWDFASIHTA